MGSKDESPKAQHASPSEEHASPKKRRKVNHGGYDRATNLYTAKCELICIATSMHILSALGELPSLSLHSFTSLRLSPNSLPPDACSASQALMLI